MTKIVYGVSGEGSGHASRAREIITHLLAKGHEVKVASYDRGYRSLHESFDVLEISGLSIVSRDNKVSTLRTLLENLKILPDGIKSLRKVRYELFRRFKPDCVITDFEPTTAYLASYYSLPLISLDNQHSMRYMHYTRPDNFSTDARLTETIIRAMVPNPDVSLITTFYTSDLKNNHSFLFPPILRESVINLKPVDGKHILVYATAGFDSLLKLLHSFKRETFIVYGYNKEEIEGNLHFREFSNTGFLHDLAASKAVIATAGFTLMTESLYLNKPYFALPMEGQFEQVLNALMLEELGYGKASFNVRMDEIAAFIYGIPDFKQNLGKYLHEGNHKITHFLDKLLANGEQKLRQYHNS